MVREIAVFEVQAGRDEGFVEAYSGVAHVLNGALGSRSATLHRGIQDANSSTLLVEWDPVGIHTELAKEPGLEEFRDAIGPYFAGHPEVWHVAAVG